MLLYRVDCADCGAPRVGRKENDVIIPLLDDCPVCGSPEYVVPSEQAE